MSEKEYYLTTADNIYGLMRKTLIYVTKINKKTFYYKIADWRANNKTRQYRYEVFVHYSQNRQGKLIDSAYFDHLPKEFIVENLIK
jgi:hypothetical protein